MEKVPRKSRGGKRRKDREKEGVVSTCMQSNVSGISK